MFATWVALAGNATNAKYSISVDGGPATVVTVNQQLSPNSALVGGTLWQKLHTITPTAGFHVVTVRLSDDANGTVVADAVFDPPQAVRKSGGKTHRGDEERGSGTRAATGSSRRWPRSSCPASREPPQRAAGVGVGGVISVPAAKGGRGLHDIKRGGRPRERGRRPPSRPGPAKG